MQIRVVHEIALNTPGFGIHLLPLGFRIDIDLKVFEPQRALTGLDGRRRWRDEPRDALSTTHAVKHLFAIC